MCPSTVSEPPAAVCFPVARLPIHRPPTNPQPPQPHDPKPAGARRRTREETAPWSIGVAAPFVLGVAQGWLTLCVPAQAVRRRVWACLTIIQYVQKVNALVTNGRKPREQKKIDSKGWAPRTTGIGRASGGRVTQHRPPPQGHGDCRSSPRGCARHVSDACGVLGVDPHMLHTGGGAARSSSNLKKVSGAILPLGRHSPMCTGFDTYCRVFIGVAREARGVYCLLSLG